MLALWDSKGSALLDGGLREALRAVGVRRLQVNLDDDAIPDSVLRLQAFAAPLSTIVTVETDGSAADVVAVLRPLAGHVAGWRVEERVPLRPPVVPDGERADALAQVAFLRRPGDLSYDDWRAHWLGPHTQIAMETQATFGYVQNEVVERLTDDTPDVAAVVEELFPTAAMHDIHAFYGSAGDDAELGRRLTRLMTSVATMGADHDLDVVPTSRYVFDLSH